MTLQEGIGLINENVSTAPVGRPFFTTGTYVLIALALVGACFAAWRFAFGLSAVTNLDNQHPWGIWIGIDVASGVALAAGGFTTAALVFVLNRRRFEPVIRPALLTAWLGYVLVAVGLLVDLGRYYNIWHPLIYWQGNSVLFEVGLCVMFYLAVLTIEFAEVVVDGLSRRLQPGGSTQHALEATRGPLQVLRRVLHRVVPVFIILGVVLSCLHQSSLGSLMLIAPHKLHPLWYTPLLPLLFLLSAIAVGLPMVIFESLLASKSFRLKPESDLLRGLGDITVWTLGVYAVVKLGDLFGRGAHVHLVNGSTQALSFIVEVLVGVLLPLVLLLLPRTRRSHGGLFIASCMIVFGVVLNRINVFLVGYQPPYAARTYFPAIGEMAVTAGLIATLVLAYRLCVTYLPILPTASEQPAPAGTRAGSAKPAAGPTSVLATPLLLLGVLVGLSATARADQVPPPGGFDIRQINDLFVLDDPLLNEKQDVYAPVRFMHRAHAARRGDCTVCHHRTPRGANDRVGVPLASQDLERATPAKCQQCHAQPLEADNPLRPGLTGALHQRCIGCHSAQQRGPVGCRECHRPHVPDHAALVQLPVNPRPQDVTRECLRCHRYEGQKVLASIHWRWRGPSPDTLGTEHQTQHGKATIINNYCIAVPSNWPRCTSCHVGYGWKDDSFDFENPENIDCLVCHDTTGTYKKYPTAAGLPVLAKEYPQGREWPPKSGKMLPPVDLASVAQSVSTPGRRNCGACHFYGGGADGVKHGDLDSTMVQPPPQHDVHMGRYNLRCQDCHTTTDHRIAGACLAIPAHEGRVRCQQCHAERPHVKNDWLDHHLNEHAEALACQTCHIPVFAKGKPTKLVWDWSQAGQDQPGGKDRHGKPTFLKKKGAFVWDMNVQPTYAWYNGKHRRCLLGETIDPEQTTWLNEPLGHIHDPRAKIYPFKIHRGRQISDAVYKCLVVPKLFGEFWKHFDWGRAAEEGMKVVGLPYSGQHEFVDTAMYWAINHEVVPRDQALSCVQCHTAENAVSCTRCHRDVSDDVAAALVGVYEALKAAERQAANIDFRQLGYRGDPALVGGRDSRLSAPKVASDR